MNFQYDDSQKAVLNLLLDKYENSRTYEGNNTRRQSFSVKPEAVFPEYRNRFADIAAVQDFERGMEAMAREGLVKVSWRTGEMEKITAVEDKIPQYYRMLGREEKKELTRQERELYQRYQGRHFVLDRFCGVQLAKLERGGKQIIQEKKRKNFFRLH